MASWTELVEEEKGEQESSNVKCRSRKEEVYLWRRLDECDRDQAKKEKLENGRERLKWLEQGKRWG
jgi:hypothetical protein